MPQGLSVVDWVVVGAYLLLVLAVGLIAGRRARSGRDFFLGGRSLPWWAATLSIVAAETSAVTYIGTPRDAFEGDWAFLQLVIGLVIGRVFLALFLVPVLYRSEILTVYGFFEARFGTATRAVAALFFLLGRAVASGVRMYAGCLALQVATGFPLGHAVLVLGGLATIYTLAGGIRAVIWTDVFLGLTFMAGGIFSALWLAGQLPEGALSDPGLLGKMTVFQGDVTLANPRSFVAGLVGGFVLTLATHGTDQDVVQRILSCRGSRGGRLSILGSAALILPLFLLFLLIGTLLYAFYTTRDPGYALPSNRDHLFPLFIVRELPRGFAGFVMAGLFAASLSSFASVLNALAATTLSDILRPVLRRVRGERSEADILRLSRPFALAWAIALLALALAFQGSSDNVLMVALRVLTYFYGALLGAFLLGAFTRRGSGASVISGMVLSVAAVILLQLRHYLEDLALAPDSLRAVLLGLPPALTDAVRGLVPLVGWPFWIIVGTAIAFSVGSFGSRRARWLPTAPASEGDRTSS